MIRNSKARERGSRIVWMMVLKSFLPKTNRTYHISSSFQCLSIRLSVYGAAALGAQLP